MERLGHVLPMGSSLNLWMTGDDKCEFVAWTSFEQK